MKQDINWNIPKGPQPVPQNLLDAGLTPLLAALLAARGFDDPEAVRDFLSPGAPESVFLPLTDLDKAAARIRLAAERGEKVAVFGDYDVDGITSTCLMTDFLRRHMGLECISYIPNRLDEGYGLSADAVDALAAQGVKLIITVDCGITALAETERARAAGVDMIVTDHHECQARLPAAAAVVDPKRDPDGPGQGLAGVGVAFMLACALAGNTAAMLAEYADLAAVGTIADVMPLTGTNRTIVCAGLDKLQRAPRPGLAALMQQSGLSERKKYASAVGFTLAPRLNAAGRLGCAQRAADLLMADQADAAASLAAELCALNRERQDMEHEIWQQALEKLAGHPPQTPIVLVDERWHQGVVGIVASRLAETYGVPAVMICLDGDRGKGSCRSAGQFNLFEALSACAAQLEGFGGHALAAGLNIAREKIPDFEVAFADYYRAHLPAGTPGLDFDLRIDDPAMLSLDCVRDLERLEPCGSGNPRPRLCMVGALVESITPMGGGRHLRLSLVKRDQRLEGVFFARTEEELGLRPGDTADLAFYPQVNEFRGRESVQLILTEMRPTDTQRLCARILAGRPPEYGEGPEIFPQRADFARIWRWLAARGGEMRCAGEALAPAFAETGLRPGTTFACLRVLAEAGLLHIEQSGGELCFTQESTSEKADLAAAPYMHILTESAEKEG